MLIRVLTDKGDAESSYRLSCCAETVRHSASYDQRHFSYIYSRTLRPVNRDRHRLPPIAEAPMMEAATSPIPETLVILDGGTAHDDCGWFLQFRTLPLDV